MSQLGAHGDMTRRATSRERAALLEGTVTSLVARERRPDRVAVYLDGAFAFEIDSQLALAENVRMGEILTVECQQRLRDSDQPNLARVKALGLLAIRERSSEELRMRLRGAGFTPETIDGVILRLQEIGYLDDLKFARDYVAEKRRSGWGDRRVRQELMRKGVGREAIETVLAEDLADDEAASEQWEVLLALVRRRFGSEFRTDSGAAERRLAGFMARRGYDWDRIAETARILRSEAEADC